MRIGSPFKIGSSKESAVLKNDLVPQSIQSTLAAKTRVLLLHRELEEDIPGIMIRVNGNQYELLCGTFGCGVCTKPQRSVACKLLPILAFS